MFNSAMIFQAKYEPRSKSTNLLLDFLFATHFSLLYKPYLQKYKYEQFRADISSI